MSDWPLEILGDYSDISARIGWRGLSSDEYIDNGPYLIAGKHIVNGRIDWRSCDHVSQWRYEESPEIALRSGDVVISKDGTIGRVARVDVLPGPATLNGTMMLVRPHHEDLDHRFLAHSLGGEAFQKLIADRVSGSSIPHLFQRDLVNLKMRMPPLDEQRQIADNLDTIDETILATERLVTKHERVRDGLAADLLWNDPAGKEAAAIGELGHVVGGGTPSRERAEYWDGTIPWLTPSELTGISDKYVRATKEGISELGISNSGATMLPRGSLLITSRASIGFCALAGIPMTTNQGFQNLIPRGNVDSSWLLHLGRGLRREMLRRASGTTFLEITGREFGRICVPHPPLHEQRRIAKILDIAGETIRQYEAQLAKLRQLRLGLAADLLSGRVRTVEV